MNSITREQKLYAAAGGMALIIISLFLKWMSVSAGGFEASSKGTDMTSWWLFGLIPAAIALVIFVMEARGMDLPVPQIDLGVAILFAVIAAVWAVSHFLDVSHRAFGAFLALIGGIVGAVAAFSLRSEA